MAKTRIIHNLFVRMAFCVWYFNERTLWRFAVWIWKSERSCFPLWKKTAVWFCAARSGIFFSFFLVGHSLTFRAGFVALSRKSRSWGKNRSGFGPRIIQNVRLYLGYCWANFRGQNPTNFNRNPCDWNFRLNDSPTQISHQVPLVMRNSCVEQKKSTSFKSVWALNFTEISIIIHSSHTQKLRLVHALLGDRICLFSNGLSGRYLCHRLFY